MHWLFLLLSLGAMAVALRTPSMALMAVSLLAALGLLIAWAMGWYWARAGNRESQRPWHGRPGRAAPPARAGPGAQGRPATTSQRHAAAAAR